MITRGEAETQAERCLEYHAGIAAGIIGLCAVIDRRAFPWVAASLGAGVALHATCLFAIPKTRESLLRTTASLMEDLQHGSSKNLGREQPSEMEMATMG
jgi:hypothetical protein